jgi:hypothetical protein
VIKARISEINASDQRVYRRRLLNVAAQVRDSASPPTDILVLDLSPNGCRISPSGTFGPGDSVWLKLPGIEAVYGSIAWASEGEAGCEFAATLPEADLSAVRQPAFLRRARRHDFGCKPALARA